jgi:uncharacterized protein (TIGR03083 family)
METSWDDSRRAYRDAAEWFVGMAERVGDRWEAPALGEWDVRALVGHTSRAFLTVETYLAVPADSVAVDSASGYFRATSAAATGPGVASRGRDAGAALGPDPAASIGEIAARVLGVVARCNGTELVSTIVGGMRLSDYLATRTFELAVHTSDLAVALGEPAAVPRSAASVALDLVAELALAADLAGPVLLAATGRGTSGFSVL